MIKTPDIYGGELDPVAPEWVDLRRAHDIIAAMLGNADDERWFRVILSSGYIAWRAKEAEESDDGELQALHGLEVDACGLRAFFGAPRFVQ